MFFDAGRPSPAEFLSQPFSRGRDFYNLSWVVTSWPPLEEVRLLWRRVQMNETYQLPGKWHDVILAPNPLTAGIGHVGNGGRHEASYMIRPLQPGAMYEAIVQAKNRYGWNEVSDLYKFYTRGASGQYTHTCKPMRIIMGRQSAPHRYRAGCIYLCSALIIIRWKSFAAAADLALLSVDVHCSFLPDEIIPAGGAGKSFSLKIIIVSSLPQTAVERRLNVFRIYILPLFKVISPCLKKRLFPPARSQTTSRACINIARDTSNCHNRRNAFFNSRRRPGAPLNIRRAPAAAEQAQSSPNRSPEAATPISVSLCNIYAKDAARCGTRCFHHTGGAPLSPACFSTPRGEMRESREAPLKTRTRQIRSEKMLIPRFHFMWRAFYLRQCEC
jgi:hypothetical protein